jgi:ABC-2 type transport system ATP-binding protein
METIVQAKALSKRYGETIALDAMDLTICAGKIVGLIGPNGAGKTTALKCLLGLASCEGELKVLGLDARRHRTALLDQVCFIADTATLPRWLKVSQALDYVEGVHPRFNRDKATKFLAATSISPNKRVDQLSKGMITQLHLALVMSIDAKLLVLDEPTLGLDIIYRKQFYASLLNDYFDSERTILITTHQVEEVETLLTDLIFIRDGRIILNTEMENLSDKFTQLQAHGDHLEKARLLHPIAELAELGGASLIFEDVEREQLAPLGKLRTPSIADLFVAKMQA